MPTQIELLATRRKALVQQAARQRDLLAHECQQLDGTLRVADTMLNLSAFFKRQPWLITLGSALVGVFSFSKWTIPKRISSIWNVARGVVSFWNKFRGS